MRVVDAVECGCKKCFQMAIATIMPEGEGTVLGEKAAYDVKCVRSASKQ